jgi:hypothetical protein
MIQHRPTFINGHNQYGPIDPFALGFQKRVHQQKDDEGNHNASEENQRILKPSPAEFISGISVEVPCKKSSPEGRQQQP